MIFMNVPGLVFVLLCYRISSTNGNLLTRTSIALYFNRVYLPQGVSPLSISARSLLDCIQLCYPTKCLSAIYSKENNICILNEQRLIFPSDISFHNRNDRYLVFVELVEVSVIHFFYSFASLIFIYLFICFFDFYLFI